MRDGREAAPPLDAQRRARCDGAGGGDLAQDARGVRAASDGRGRRCGAPGVRGPAAAGAGGLGAARGRAGLLGMAVLAVLLRWRTEAARGSGPGVGGARRGASAPFLLTAAVRRRSGNRERSRGRRERGQWLTPSDGASAATTAGTRRGWRRRDHAGGGASRRRSRSGRMRRWWAWAAASRGAGRRAMGLTVSYARDPVHLRWGIPHAPTVVDRRRECLPPLNWHSSGVRCDALPGSLGGDARNVCQAHRRSISTPREGARGARLPAVRRGVARPTARPRAQRQPRHRAGRARRARAGPPGRVRGRSFDARRAWRLDGRGPRRRAASRAQSRRSRRAVGAAGQHRHHDRHHHSRRRRPAATQGPAHPPRPVSRPSGHDPRADPGHDARSHDP